MADVLEIVDGSLDRDHVVRRVDDWKARVDSLYDNLQAWLPEGWSSQRRRVRLMREELMREFDVAPVALAFLDIRMPSGAAATVEPRGLWIIGANGRLDLTTSAVHYVIVDQATSFADPDWMIAPLAARGDGRPLNQDAFLSALGG